MAKSKKERLQDLISEATKAKESGVIGDQEGQYVISDVERLDTVIIAAMEIVSQDDVDANLVDESLVTISEALKEFKQAAITLLVNDAKVQEEPISLIEVELKGSPSQCTGNHSLHFKDKIINFKDGKADIPEEVANELKEAGYVQ